MILCLSGATHRKFLHFVPHGLAFNSIGPFIYHDLNSQQTPYDPMSSHASPRLDSPLPDSLHGSTSRPAPTGTRKRSNTRHDSKPPPPRKQSLDYLHSPSKSSLSHNIQRSHTTNSNLLRKPEPSGSRRKGSSADPPPIPSTSYSHSAHAEFPNGGPHTPIRDTGKFGPMPSTMSPISSSSPSFTSPAHAPGQGISSSVPSTLSSLRTNTTESSSFNDRSFSMPVPHRQGNSSSSYEPSPLANAYNVHSQLNSSHTHHYPHTTPNLRMQHPHRPGSRAANGSGVARSRKSSSAGSSDRELLVISGGTGVGALDFKRLLSKPAMPTHSGGASIISLPSDVELSGSSPSSPKSRTRTGSPRTGGLVKQHQRMTTHDSPSSSFALSVLSGSSASLSLNSNARAGAASGNTGMNARPRNLSASNEASIARSARQRSSAVARESNDVAEDGEEEDQDYVLLDASDKGISHSSPTTAKGLGREEGGSSHTFLSSPRDATDNGEQCQPGAQQPQLQPQIVQKSIRNVLKRKSSSSKSRSSPSTPTVSSSKTVGALSRESSSSRSTSKPTSLSVESATRRSSVSRRDREGLINSTHLPTSPSAVLPESVLARSSKLREPPAPPGLTPAGAVAHAYKQQEQRREELAEDSGWDEQQQQQQVGTVTVQHRPNMASVLSHAHHRSSDLAYLASGGEEEESNGPYYTVFGSTSGRVVTAGGPQDSSWDLTYDGLFGAGTVAVGGDDRDKDRGREKKKGSGGKSGTTTPTGSVSSGVKSLSRKVSGRFKKVTGVGKGQNPRDFSPHARSEIGFVPGDGADGAWLPYDGRRSVQGRSREGTPRPSIDTNVREFGVVEKEVRQQSSDDPRKSLAGDGDSNAGCGGTGRPLRSMRSFRYDEDKRQRHREEEMSPGGKLWKLVKRLSTGGLRDKYISRDSSEPPPVPALPEDFRKPPTSRMTLDIAKPPESEVVGEPGVLLSKFMQSRTSLSGVRPSMGSSHKSSRSRPSIGKDSGSPSGHRPSTTTRSSSPMSSDIASARFFHKPHSNRSSTSSYGEELPPLPAPGSPTKSIAQHILSPSELHRLHKDAEGTPPVPQRSRKPRKSGRSRSVPGNESGLVASLDEVRPSLPHPPRRSATTGGKVDSPSSPTVPTFNATKAVNDLTLPPRVTLSMSEFGVAPSAEGVPPRPRRSSRRQPPPELTRSPSSPLGPTSPPMPATPRTPLLPTLHVDFFHSKRKSISSASIRTPTKLSPHSPSPVSRSPVAFRELESPRHAWSEKEKAAKWDDLLERSERAGGTLHVGGDLGSGLMSDKLRLSVCSDILES